MGCGTSGFLLVTGFGDSLEQEPHFATGDGSPDIPRYAARLATLQRDAHEFVSKSRHFHAVAARAARTVEVAGVQMTKWPKPAFGTPTTPRRLVASPPA